MLPIHFSPRIIPMDAYEPAGQVPAISTQLYSTAQHSIARYIEHWGAGRKNIIHILSPYGTLFS